MPYQYEPFELQLLGDFLHTGTQAAGNTWRPSAQEGNSELDSHEVAEVVFMEIVSPVTADGTPEPLERIQLVLDDKPYGSYINILGTDTYLVFPPKGNAVNGQILAFGTPLINAIRGSAPLLEGTCPKYNKSVRIETVAGTGGITADYRIRLWGYRYPTQELTRLFPSPVGGTVEVRDERTNRVLTVTKAPVTVSWSTWTQLPGGVDQAMPKINAYIRYSRNATATTPNTPYQFRYEVGTVASREEDLYWPFDIENKALIIKGIGVRGPGNLESAFLNIDGKDRPKKRWPTSPQTLNPIHFGRAYPLLPDTIPLYYTIPKLDRPYLVWQDKGYVAVQDNGTSVSANSITVVINGVFIEMSGA